MKKDFGRHLRNYWNWYAAWAFVSVTSLAIAFSIRTKVKEEDKMDFLIVSERFETDKFRLWAVEKKPSYLHETNFRHLTPNDRSFFSVLSTYGALEADIFILPSSSLDKIELKTLFLPLERGICQQTFKSDLTYYSHQGIDYAFKIEFPYAQGEEGFYLGFGKNSPHLGKLYGLPLDGAIVYAKEILK